ncbi:hypothetical protein HZC31_01425 [Candidatus Woesearchaeota archaeon]|nr:hypothetical protein [Candidatus Woesearchaeota archaeon]
MVIMQQQRAMANFVTKLVETADRYDIREKTDDHLLVAQKREIARNPEHPVQVYIALLTGNMTIAEYNRLVGQNTQQGVYTANVFYKDGETAMVRLGARGHVKGNDRSLKLYCKTDIDKMVHLRGLEARVLEIERPAETLVYYQPETARLPESLRGYEMRSVTLDYTHLEPGDKGYGFREGKQTAADYRLAEEVYQRLASDSVMFKDTGSRRYTMNIVPPTAQPIQVAPLPQPLHRVSDSQPTLISREQITAPSTTVRGKQLPLFGK